VKGAYGLCCKGATVAGPVTYGRRRALGTCTGSGGRHSRPARVPPSCARSQKLTSLASQCGVRARSVGYGVYVAASSSSGYLSKFTRRHEGGNGKRVLVHTRDGGRAGNEYMHSRVDVEQADYESLSFRRDGASMQGNESSPRTSVTGDRDVTKLHPRDHRARPCTCIAIILLVLTIGDPSITYVVNAFPPQFCLRQLLALTQPQTVATQCSYYPDPQAYASSAFSIRLLFPLM
jgi:hypothetical protein